MMGYGGGVWAGFERITPKEEEPKPDARAVENARLAAMLERCPMRTVCLTCVHAILRDEGSKLLHAKPYDSNASSAEAVFIHHRTTVLRTRCSRCSVERDTARFVFVKRET